jgi:methionyl-tRNA synthetase
MSKSLNNFIPPQQLVDQYGVDPVRYFMLRELPFGSDGDLSHRAMVNRINGDLANGLGNLAQRVLTLIQKNCAAQVPTPGALTSVDEELLAAARALLPKLRDEVNEQAFHKALDILWQVVGAADRYIDDQAPWALRKTDIARMNTVLYVLAETLRHIAILVQPVMPASAAALLDQLGIPAGARDFAGLVDRPLEGGTALPPPRGLFPRLVEAEGQGAQ